MTSDPRLKAAHDQLKKIRERTDLSLRPTKYLKQTFTDFNGEEQPLTIRYYQVQGILHLVAMNRFLLGDDTGIGKCCVGDTLIRTSRGLIPIQELNPGISEPDTFAPLKEDIQVEVGASRYAVGSFYYGGAKPTIKVTTSFGYGVEGSQIHPIRIRRNGVEQWVRLRDVCEGDYVVIDRTPTLERIQDTQKEPEILPEVKETLENSGYGFPSSLSPRFSRLLGYLFFNSCTYYEFYSNILKAQKPEVFADLKTLCASFLGIDLEKDDECLSDPTVVGFLENIGLSRKGSTKSKLPSFIFRGSQASVREFLKGFFDGCLLDDCLLEPSAYHPGHPLRVRATVIQFRSYSETLIKQLQLLLLTFGIVACKKFEMDHSWLLQINGDNLRRYVREIGFISKSPKHLLNSDFFDGDHFSNSLDVVPGAKDALEDLLTEVYTKAQIAKANQNSSTAPFNIWNQVIQDTLDSLSNSENPTYRDLEKGFKLAREAGVSELNPAYTAVQAILTQRWFYDPVVSIKKGWAEVFDIEVKDPTHAFVGNGIVNHNTIQSIASLCYVWEKEPERKVIVLTNKSVVGQWAMEFEKFCVADTINILPCVGTPAKREKVYKEFSRSKGPTVLIMGYATSRRDVKHIQDYKDFILVTDECSAYKNPSTQTYKVVRHLASQATRVWGLSATLIKNNLIEGYGIYSVLVPGLFPSSKNKFMNEYCLTRLQSIPGSRRQIPVIVGYRKEQIEKFRTKIDPYFLARAKFDVAKELPVLQIKQHKCGMTREQEIKYKEALAGLLEKDFSNEEVETTKLTALIYCQQIVDHPELVDCEGDSDKMNELFDLLTEGDLSEEKIVVFSRFRKMVDKLEKVAHSKYKIKTVRVTGNENEDERKEAMRSFQDPNSDVRVCWITEAAKEGINLQAAKALIFYDSPWSAGDYIQILGRIVRIGSTHDRCYAIHLVSKGTIDTKVMGVLRTKMKLIEQVMGKRIKGEDMADISVKDSNSIDDIFSALQADARTYKG